MRERSGCTAVVPAYRSAQTLARTLQSLVFDNCDGVDRVVVVCSPASDQQQIRIAERFPRVTVVSVTDRLGAGAARNLGACHADKPEFLLFVDADCAVPAGGARDLMAEASKTALVCNGASIMPTNWRPVSAVRHLLEFKDSEPGVSDVPGGIVPSATMLCEREAFERVGGFPDLWPGEDLVLCRRLQLRGLGVGRSRQVVSRHLHPRGIGELLRHQLRLGRSSASARLLVELPGSRLLRRPWLAPALFFGRWARAWVWILRHRPAWVPIFILLSPLYLSGLAAWTIGFTAEAWCVWAGGRSGNRGSSGTGGRCSDTGDSAGSNTTWPHAAATAAERRHRSLEHP